MKRFVVFLLVVVAVISSVSSAFAAVWKEVARSDKIIVSLECSTIEHSKDLIRVWRKTILRNSREQKELSKDWGLKKPVAYFITYDEYDVRKPKRQRTLELAIYDQKGHVLDSGEVSDSTFSRIIPGSVDDLVVYSAIELATERNNKKLGRVK